MRITGARNKAVAAGAVTLLGIGSLAGCAQQPALTAATIEDFQAAVVETYVHELMATGDPVAAEEALFGYYTDSQRQEREQRHHRYADAMRATTFAQQHPNFTVEEATIRPHSDHVLSMEWDAAGCGGIDVHQTAFLVQVEETSAGTFAVERFSHAQGCGCGACIAA